MGTNDKKMGVLVFEMMGLWHGVVICFLIQFWGLVISAN